MVVKVRGPKLYQFVSNTSVAFINNIYQLIAFVNEQPDHLSIKMAALQQPYRKSVEMRIR
jgi:hypothetical protein